MGEGKSVQLCYPACDLSMQVAKTKETRQRQWAVGTILHSNCWESGVGWEE